MYKKRVYTAFHRHADGAALIDGTDNTRAAHADINPDKPERNECNDEKYSYSEVNNAGTGMIMLKVMFSSICNNFVWKYLFDGRHKRNGYGWEYTKG